MKPRINTPLLRHVTTPAVVERVLKTKNFVAGGKNPWNADYGANFLSPVPTAMPQRFEGYGAMLLCVWEGATSISPPSTCPPYVVGVLHDMRPWRYFVPVGCPDSLLRVVGVSFTLKSLDEHLGRPWWFKLLSARSQTIFQKRRRIAFRRELRKIYSDEDCYLTVTA